MSAPDTLLVVAGKITELLSKSDRAIKKAADYRISAGQLLLEARRRVDSGEAGEIGWEEWCRVHVDRSLRDIRRIMHLAGAADPEQALEDERACNRVHKANSRAADSQSGQVDDPAEGMEEDLIEAAKRLIDRMTPEQLGYIVNYAATKAGAEMLGCAKDAAQELDPVQRRDLLDWLADEVREDERLTEPTPEIIEADDQVIQMTTGCGIPLFQTTQASLDANELLNIFTALKPNSQKCALRWIENGCPSESDPNEHHRITEALISFRSTASKLPPKALLLFTKMVADREAA